MLSSNSKHHNFLRTLCSTRLFLQNHFSTLQATCHLLDPVQASVLHLIGYLTNSLTMYRKRWPLNCARSPRASSILTAARQSTAHRPQQHTTGNCTTFQPPLVDISNVLAYGAPTLQQAQQVQQECLSTGFLAVTGHGIADIQLQQLFEAAERLFDLSMEAKQQLVVQDMQRGRGYEISPEHKQYMQQFTEVCTKGDQIAEQSSLNQMSVCCLASSTATHSPY